MAVAINIFKFLGLDKKEVEEISKEVSSYYLSYSIRKKNPSKKRWINAPQGRLKEIQKIILYKLLYKFKCHKSVYGFVKNKNPQKAADRHTGKEILMTLDIQDFFPSIVKYHVVKVLMFLTKKFNIEASELDIDTLANVLTYFNSVPQGASSSPAVSNIVFRSIDKELNELAKEECIDYTRYADDLIFTSKDPTYRMYSIIPKISSILYKEGFKLNYKKVNIRRKNKCMKVLGIVVNEKINYKRDDYRILRSKIYNYIRDNKTITKKELQELNGVVSWVTSLNPNIGRNLKTMIGKIPYQHC